MTVSTGRSSAACSFRDCSESIVSRVVLALVDQLCAGADSDVDIALLDALDYPLGLSLGVLHPFGITGAIVTVGDGELIVEIQLSTTVPSATDILRDADDVVSAFFDVTTTPAAASINLVGSLG